MGNVWSAAELRDAIERGDAPVLLDVRWRLDRPHGHDEYRRAHLPGAVYVDLESELSGTGTAQDGRHPLPSVTRLQAAARRWGIRTGRPVVAYDDAGGLPAARAWWLLSQAGVPAGVLDGGLGGWTAMGGELHSGDVTPESGDVELGLERRDSLSIEEAAAFPEQGILVDVRAAERYRGELEPLDPVAGHIPGAVNLPTTAHLRADGMLHDSDTLRESFARVGVRPGTPVAVYCGSGVTAAHSALVLAELGISAQLYAGSWSQWSNTPGRPVATGNPIPTRPVHRRTQGLG